MTDLEKRAFQHGYLVACCNVFNLHNEPGIASDVLREAGITEADVRSMDLTEYDEEALRVIRRDRIEDPIEG